MGEHFREIPKEERLTSRDEQHEVTAADFDSSVQAAVAHMEAHAGKLDDEQVTPLDAVMDEYSETLKLLAGDLDPATRLKIESQRDALRDKISSTAEFDRTVEQEMDGATEREASLHERGDILLEKHALGEKQEPVDPSTPAAEMLRECRRVKLLTENLFQKTQKEVSGLPAEDQPKTFWQLDRLKINLLVATEKLSSSKLDTRYPEHISMDIWQTTLTKLQASLEKVLMLNREVAERVKRGGQVTKNTPPAGSLKERPS